MKNQFDFCYYLPTKKSHRKKLLLLHDFFQQILLSIHHHLLFALEIKHLCLLSRRIGLIDFLPKPKWCHLLFWPSKNFLLMKFESNQNYSLFKLESFGFVYFLILIDRKNYLPKPIILHQMLML